MGLKRRRAFVALARIADDALHVVIAPRFFRVIGKMVVGHVGDYQTLLQEIADVLEVAEVALNVEVGEFPALAVAAQQGIAVAVLLNSGGDGGVAIAVELVPKL
jgi:hypothetical protein